MPPDRVLVDTNVLISGIVFSGNEFDLLALAKTGQIRLVLAEFVVSEARRVIAYRFPGFEVELERFLGTVGYESVALPDERVVRSAGRIVRDPNDAAVLASILMAKPDVALTGDKDLLTDEVKAVAPACRCAEYLERLEQDE